MDEQEIHKTLSIEWNIWQRIHKDQDQLARQRRAAEVEIQNLDAQNGCCMVAGESEEFYQTSLSKCACFDFQRREKPCKHMYRLAAELGLLQLPSPPSPSSAPPPGKAVLPKDYEDKIRDLGDKDLYALLYFIWSHDNPQDLMEVPRNQKNIYNSLADKGFAVVETSPEVIIAKLYTIEELQEFIERFDMKNGPAKSSRKNAFVQYILNDSQVTQRLIKNRMLVHLHPDIVPRHETIKKFIANTIEKRGGVLEKILGSWYEL